MPTLVQPFPMRSSISDAGRELRLCIPCFRSWRTIAFFSLWLPLWTIGGLTIGYKLIHDFDLFTFFWILFWIFSEIMVVYYLLRMIFGRDVIIVAADTLTVRKELFGFARTQTYLISDIRNLRFQPEVGAGKGRTASRIAFDYGAKTLSFAKEIEEAEANALIRLINTRYKIATAAATEPGIRFWQHT